MEIKVFDNYYGNVDAVRDYALSLDFPHHDNYPGWRTDTFGGADHDAAVQAMRTASGQPVDGFFHSSFQYTTETCESWVHSDGTNWAGVLYLTPNAPADSGTVILKHKETGNYHWYEGGIDHNYDGSEHNLDMWEPIATIGNVYNRLVIYSGKYYHRSNVPGFGTNKHDARLFQVFFFD